MNTNQFGKDIKLLDVLNIHFEKKLNQARIKFICLFIKALCKSQTVCFSKLAIAFDSPANSDSSLRRIQRFIAKFSLEGDLISKMIFSILPHEPPYQLTIDRSNWKFGETDINVFMLGIVYQGVAYPLMFTMLPKRGNSNTKERISLIERYIKLFGRETIDVILADREFVGEEWMAYLNEKKIRYYLRIRNNFEVFIPKNGHKVKASWLFTRLRLGESMHLHKIYYVNNQACYLSGSKVKGKDGNIEYQIIVSFNKPEKAIETYRNRWQIEMTFRAMKSSGFNIEDTHLSDIQRIEKLLLLVMIAFVWVYNVGDYVHRNIKEIKLKKHGKKAKSIFRYGLDIVSESLYESINQFSINIFQFLSCT